MINPQCVCEDHTLKINIICPRCQWVKTNFIWICSIDKCPSFISLAFIEENHWPDACIVLRDTNEELWVGVVFICWEPKWMDSVFLLKSSAVLQGVWKLLCTPSLYSSQKLYIFSVYFYLVLRGWNCIFYVSDYLLGSQKHIQPNHP